MFRKVSSVLTHISDQISHQIYDGWLYCTWRTCSSERFLSTLVRLFTLLKPSYGGYQSQALCDAPGGRKWYSRYPHLM